jgi:hypothetical protein
MKPSADISTDPSTSRGVYVVRLLAAPAGTATRLCGQLEHVLSGRRHDFDDGHALLACLRHEQRQVLRSVSDSAA